MSETPLLTISIPTYNRADDLSHLLDSILPQILPGVEILVSDNASTDTTTEVVQRYIARHPAIRYVRHVENIGIDRNVDAAVVNATGTYVWLCGDDDALESGAVAHLLSVLRQGEFAGGWINYSSWDVRLQKCDRASTADLTHDLIGVGIGDMLRVSHFFFSFLSTHVVRRELWIKVAERDRCFGKPFTDCVWMLGHLVAGIGGKQFVIAAPILRQRASIYDPSIVAERPIGLNWCKIMRFAQTLGVPREDIDPFFEKMVNGLHLTRGVLFKKRFAPPAARREMMETIGFFWRYPAFWLTVMPLYLIPAGAVRGLQRLYRNFRRITGVRYAEGL